MRLSAPLFGLVLVLIAGAALVFWFWPAGDLDEIRPALKPVPPVEPFTGTSRVAIPIRIPLPVLEEALNKEVQPTFTGTQRNPIKGPVKKDRLEWTIDRGTVRVSSRHRQLILEGPVTGRAELTGELRPIGGDLGRLLGKPKLSVSTDADVEADIWLAASPILLPDWSIRPNLEAKVDIQYIEAPLQRFGPVDLTPIIKTYLENEVYKLIEKTNRKLERDTFVRKEAAKAWNALSRVFPLGKKPRSWLIVRPVGFEATQPQIDEEAIMITLGLVAETSVVISETRPEVTFEKITADTLPSELTLLTSAPQGDFALAIPAALDYPAINREVERQIERMNRKNKPIRIKSDDVGDITMRIETAKVYPSGSGLLVAARVDAQSSGILGRKVKANLIFEAQPALDQDNQALVLKDPDFSVETRDMLVGSAAWLLKPVVLESLRDSLTIDLAPLAADAKEKAALEVEKIRPKMPPGVDLTLDLQEVVLGGVKVGPDALYLLVEGYGPINLTVEPSADLFSSQ